MMLDKLKAWLKSKNISAHTFTVGWGVACSLWATNHSFRDYLYGLYQKTPHYVHDFVVGIILPLALYYKSQKKSDA